MTSNSKFDEALEQKLYAYFAAREHPIPVSLKARLDRAWEPQEQRFRLPLLSDLGSLRSRLLLASFVALCGLVAFAVFSVVYRPSMQAVNPYWSTGSSGPFEVHSLADASRIAGFKVKEPAWLPAGFERAEIGIMPFPKIGEVQLPPQVAITWTSSTHPGAWLQLFQDTTTDGLGNSKPVQIGNLQGQRTFEPAEGTRPVALVTYFWQLGKVSYMLTGPLTGSLTEEDILATARSLR